jgi:hypothetical protein
MWTKHFSAIFLFLISLGIGLDVGSALAQNGSVTFRITNKATYTIYLKMYSENRSWVWPGGTNHWTLDDNAEHAFTLTCNVGEKVCYGGGYSQDGKGTYWGVGFLNNHGCTACCLTCGANNPTHGWSLDN